MLLTGCDWKIVLTKRRFNLPKSTLSIPKRKAELIAGGLVSLTRHNNNEIEIINWFG
jgi:hypothetical protein